MLGHGCSSACAVAYGQEEGEHSMDDNNDAKRVFEANGTAQMIASATSAGAAEIVERVEVDAEHMYTEDSALIGLRVEVCTPWPYLWLWEKILIDVNLQHDPLQQTG